MAPRRSLVMGASGFLGSHVTRQLVERGDDVRVLLRETSSTRGIDDLDVERCYGDIFDDDAVRAAMADRDVVFYCVVDARAMLPDAAPLFRTNVDGLRQVLDIAVDAGLDKFVFVSTICTIAVSGDGSVVDEDTPFNWADKGGDYVRSRRAAEQLVLDAAMQRGLPAVAMCVSNTYGPRDWQPTPHGEIVARTAAGRMRFYASDAAAEVVGIEDAARALLLGAERGRVGERYIISESYLPLRTILETAADETGVPPPRFGVPKAVMYAGAYATQPLRTLRPGKIPPLVTITRLLHMTSPAANSKARRELGWEPEPTVNAIRRAARFYADNQLV
ncbi:MAG: NAD-dependent epimerase/dehydratase family protein [Mycolicibacterium sp.]|uniref:NAD-dependent epimerase/dehydratase family protein n=1 Tax=Mycolicibacterium sp. TaxID=2320850 RepID=UPI000F93DC87|nr:NAD-dependent epimerase/dehydratase family protein [Mycolicibacterium sp.]RUP32318.1 MAG: NAD-dependent epimerase/dehydratase family protein [Mycolicibacterium sp.]